MAKTTANPVNIPDIPTKDESDQYSIEANLKSIMEIPWEQMPWPAVRLAVLRWAIEGAEVYAYRPAHQPEYVIWHRQAQPWMEARFKPRAWAIRYGYLSADDGVDETTATAADGKEAH